jgi:hypothetical protein
MSLWKSIAKSWAAFLQRLAKTNQETYGDGKPDCCSSSRKK